MLASRTLASRTLASLTLVSLTLAGCGANGYSGFAVPTPQTDVPRLAGVVLAPNGELARAQPIWWPAAIGLAARAYAQQGVLPVGPDEEVTLSLVDKLDAADGRIGNTPGDAPRLIAHGSTNPDGTYEILDPSLANVDQCRLMVYVGSDANATLTRAFVFSNQTDIDYMTEAVVQVVLHRLTQAPSVELCDFTSTGLNAIYEAVKVAASAATGDTVFAINADAFALAEASCRVQQAVEQATNVPVNPSPVCVGTPPPG